MCASSSVTRVLVPDFTIRPPPPLFTVYLLLLHSRTAFLLQVLPKSRKKKKVTRVRHMSQGNATTTTIMLPVQVMISSGNGCPLRSLQAPHQPHLMLSIQESHASCDVS